MNKKLLFILVCSVAGIIAGFSYLLLQNSHRQKFNSNQYIPSDVFCVVEIKDLYACNKWYANNIDESLLFPGRKIKFGYILRYFQNDVDLKSNPSSFYSIFFNTVELKNVFVLSPNFFNIPESSKALNNKGLHSLGKQDSVIYCLPYKLAYLLSCDSLSIYEVARKLDQNKLLYPNKSFNLISQKPTHSDLMTIYLNTDSLSQIENIKILLHGKGWNVLDLYDYNGNTYFSGLGLNEKAAKNSKEKKQLLNHDKLRKLYSQTNSSIDKLIISNTSSDGIDSLGAKLNITTVDTSLEYNITESDLSNFTLNNSDYSVGNMGDNIHFINSLKNLPSAFNYFSYTKDLQEANFFIKDNASLFSQVSYSDSNIIQHYLFAFNQKEAIHPVERSNETKVQLSGTLTIKPQIVKNHYNQNNEIFIQDQNLFVYLIDYEGNILFQKQLEDKIISEAHQIDYFKNNKLQLLFNTATKVYLLDRNGNNVSPFPLVLPARATNGLAVFDYDNKKEYRILIACDNNKIYNFNKSGKAVKGWKSNTDSEVTIPIQHYVINNKDYIVVAERNGKISVLDRRGNERVSIKKKVSIEPDQQIYFNQNDNKLYTLSKTGKIYVVDFKGSVDSIDIDIDSKHLPYFLAENINAPYYFAFIAAYPKKIEVINVGDKNKLTHSINGKIEFIPNMYVFSATDRKIGYVTDEHLIYLLNFDGSLYRRFPREGVSPFSISDMNRDGVLELIVGGKENTLIIDKL